MTKDNLLSLLRTLLTFFGMYFIGHKFLGQPITTDVWDIIIGSGLTLIGTVWSIVDKSATIEKVEAAIRSVFIGFGGFLVTAGIIKAETLASIIGLITPILAFIQSVMAKAKVKQLAVGNLVPVASTGLVKKAA